MVTSSVKDVVDEVKRVLLLEGNSILDSARRIENSDAEQLNRAIQFLKEALDRGGKIVVTGVGKSGKVGQKIAATLCSTGSLAIFLHPTEGLHGDLGMVTSQDVVLALSYTGNTDELVRLIPSLKNLKIRLISLCGNRHSKLVEASDAWIDASVAQEACPHNLAPTSSTTLALALGDALAVAMMKLKGFEPSEFAQNHPGGSIGKKLNLTVADVMHQNGAVAVVGPEATMDEVIVVSTTKKLGAVLIVEGSQLLGIITDGDLRRALQHREKFFRLKAKEVMTSQPVTARPEMMADAALKLMENRSSQISVLPVVDSAGAWVGLVRVHDLVRAF